MIEEARCELFIINAEYASDTLTVNEPIEIDVVVANTGNTEAKDVLVIVHDQYGWTEDATISSIKPAETGLADVIFTITESMKQTILDRNPHEFEAIVDPPIENPSGRITEEDETNNKYTLPPITILEDETRSSEEPAEDQAEEETGEELDAAEDVELLVNEKYDYSFRIPPVPSKVILSFDARIVWDKLAGSASAMQINVNKKTLTDRYLLNKSKKFTFSDGRNMPYFYSRHPAGASIDNVWQVFYSPDYISNNKTRGAYRVAEGNAYWYQLDITGFVKKGRTNKVTFRNVGSPEEKVVRKKFGKDLILAIKNIQITSEPIEGRRYPKKDRSREQLKETVIDLLKRRTSSTEDEED